jgi:predicted transcriptional regulator of viral defense system
VLIAAVASIADEQWGLVTTAQARAASVSPQSMARLANEGVLERVAHGVYRVLPADSQRDQTSDSTARLSLRANGRSRLVSR